MAGDYELLGICIDGIFKAEAYGNPDTGPSLQNGHGVIFSQNNLVLRHLSLTQQAYDVVTTMVYDVMTSHQC